MTAPLPALLPIQVADISRAVIMYAEGGYYVDTDVEPMARARNSELTGRVLGLESNFSAQKAASMGMMRRSLAMWAFHGTKGDVWWLHLAEALVQNVRRAARGDYHHYIHVTTGPTAWTRFAGGIALEPVYTFGCGQAHSRSPPCGDRRCWCCHHFAGSWHQH
jgi:hypothetical protein